MVAHPHFYRNGTAWRRHVSRTAGLTLAMALIVSHSPSAYAQIERLFGTWPGTWLVDGKLSSSGRYGQELDTVHHSAR